MKIIIVLCLFVACAFGYPDTEVEGQRTCYENGCRGYDVTFPGAPTVPIPGLYDVQSTRYSSIAGARKLGGRNPLSYRTIDDLYGTIGLLLDGETDYHILEWDYTKLAQPPAASPFGPHGSLGFLNETQGMHVFLPVVENSRHAVLQYAVWGNSSLFPIAIDGVKNIPDADLRVSGIPDDYRMLSSGSTVGTEDNFNYCVGESGYYAYTPAGFTEGCSVTSPNGYSDCNRSKAVAFNHAHLELPVSGRLIITIREKNGKNVPYHSVWGSYSITRYILQPPFFGTFGDGVTTQLDYVHSIMMTPNSPWSNNQMLAIAYERYSKAGAVTYGNNDISKKFKTFNYTCDVMGSSHAYVL